MPELKRYRVHIYAIVRVPVLVEAGSMEAALEEADAKTDLHAILDNLGTFTYVDDVDGFLVDELNADGEWDENCESIAFDKEKRPQ